MKSQILAEDASFHMKQCLFDQYQNWSVQRPLSLSGSLAGSSKTAPRILIFSIAIGAEYLSDVKSIATFTPTFYGYYYFQLSQCGKEFNYLKLVNLG